MRTVEFEALSALLARVPPRPRVVVSGHFATPSAALSAVDAVLPEYRLFLLNAQPGIPDREGVTPETPFVGPGMRGHPRLSYVPCRLSLVPRLCGTTLPPDVVVLHTSVPRDGAVSLGTEVNILPAAIDAARRRGGIVLAQANSRMPWTFGDAVVPLDDIDAVIEEDEPLPVHTALPPDDTAAEIGQRVASRVRDGSTVQTGIGVRCQTRY